MIRKHNVLSRFLVIRITFPLVIVAVLSANPVPRVFIFGLLIINVLDVVGVLVQHVFKPSLWDCQFAAVRDTIYALVFYSAFIQNPHVPVLVLFPSTLAELFLLFGYRIFYRAIILEMVLLVVRMAIIYHEYHALHPTWAILIGVASIVMGLLGLEIKQLQELQENIEHQQDQLKETLTKILATMLSPSGIDEDTLHRENISPLIDEICEVANTAKGKEIGERLAEIIATKQAAVNLFTARELEIILLISQDNSYRQIAEKLQVSEGTIRAHAASIMRKADVHSRSEMIAWAHEHRLLSDMQLQHTPSEQ